VRRLVISDLHLGSFYAKEIELINFFKENNNFDELILAGDIIDFIRVPQFTEQTTKLFKFVSNFKGKVFYIVGNHDLPFKNCIGSHLFGVEFVEYYEFEEEGKKFRIEHGDRYEKGIIHRRSLMNIISVFQDILERAFKWNLSAWWQSLFTKKKKVRRIWDILQWNEEADVFIMGHNHEPEVLIWVNEHEEIKTYVNCGDWTDHCTYVTVIDGVTRLKKFILP
jgi:UDP-2,3-diacylglucosamine pyrophosphatase LpxH